MSPARPRVLSNVGLPAPEGYVLRTFGDYLPEGPGAPWEAQKDRRDLAEILALIPAAEKPDLLLISSPEYLPIPVDMAAFPGPKILLITDWNVCLRFLPDLCPLFDFCFTDWPGYRLLRRAGLANVHHQPLFGHDPGRFVDRGKPRNLEVSFCGNLNAGLHRERNRLLARLGRWGRGRPVHLGQAFDAEYLGVLNRSRLVFNYSIRGEANMRLFEAMACGAVPLVEAGNQEAAILFQEGRHYFRYEPDRLEERLDSLLADPARIEAVAAEAKRAVAGHTKADQIRALLDRVGREEPGHLPRTQGKARLLGEPSVSHEALVKLRVLGMAYTMADALSELQDRSATWPGLGTDTLPAALLSLLEDNPGRPLAAVRQVLERMLADGSQPEAFRLFLRMRLGLLDGAWQAVLRTARECLSALDSIRAAGTDPVGPDREGGAPPHAGLRLLYGRFHPPIGLGKGFNSDINRAFREDLETRSRSAGTGAGDGKLPGYSGLLGAHCLDAQARALLALDRPAEALACAERIPPDRYVSLDPHALLAETLARLGDGPRLRGVLEDWFREKPLDTGAWDKIVAARMRLGDKPELVAFLEEILVLSRYFLPPDQVETVRALLERERTG